MRVPIFHINDQSKDVTLSAESQFFPGLFALLKSSKNFFILFHSIWGILFPRLKVVF